MARVYAMVGIFVSLILVALAWYWSFLWAMDGGSKPGSFGLGQKPNWLLYPLFFVLIAWLVDVTWDGFIGAWEELKRSGILRARAPCSEVLPISELLQSCRKVCFAAALAVGLLITYVDTGCVARQYGLDFASSFWPGFSYGKCSPEVDFFTAFQRPDHYPGMPADFKQINLFYSVSWYLLQAFLISGAFLALFQVCVHQIVFMQLRSKRFSRKYGLAGRAKMDPFDRLREFGLHPWNHVLNYSYFAIAVCMLIPIVSHLTQTDPDPDIGQVMLQSFLPLIFLVPIVLGVIARQLYLDDVKQHVAAVLERLTSEQITLFHDQALRPFDRSTLGKGAFSVILIEYGIVASNAPELVRTLTDALNRQGV